MPGTGVAAVHRQSKPGPVEPFPGGRCGQYTHKDAEPVGAEGRWGEPWGGVVRPGNGGRGLAVLEEVTRVDLTVTYI